MQRLTFGSITVDAVTDGDLSVPLALMLPGAAEAGFANYGGVDAAGMLTLPMLSFVIRASGRLIVVDTGIGATLGSLGNSGFGGTAGQLPGGLAAADVDPARVDDVVFTHLHTDHIGWNVTGEGDDVKPTFPNARYVVAETEWAFWSGTKSKDIARCVRTIEAAGQLTSVADGFEVAPGIVLFATPGHTPGHTSVLVRDGGAGAVITGDAAHHPGEMVTPEFRAAHDADPEQSSASRVRLVERIEADGLTVLGGHFPPPSAGHVVRVEGKRTWHWIGA